MQCRARSPSLSQLLTRSLSPALSLSLSPAKTGLLRKAFLMLWFARCAFHFGLTELFCNTFLTSRRGIEKFVVIADGCLHFHLCSHHFFNCLFYAFIIHLSMEITVHVNQCRFWAELETVNISMICINPQLVSYD